MQESKEEIISNVVIDVLEELAFMFGEKVDKDELPKNGAGYIQVKMGFTGPQNGEISLTVPEGVSAEIASNILGVDLEEDEVKENNYDALKEVLNVICGQVLTSLEGEEPIFDLSVPENHAIGADEWGSMLNKAEVLGFIVDEIPVLLYLELERSQV